MEFCTNTLLLQGFFVSVLYCLLNGEVRSEISKKWHYCSTWEKCVAHNHHRSYSYDTTVQSSQRGKTTTSYLGAVFNKRRHNYYNKAKRGSMC